MKAYFENYCAWKNKTHSIIFHCNWCFCFADYQEPLQCCRCWENIFSLHWMSASQGPCESCITTHIQQRGPCLHSCLCCWTGEVLNSRWKRKKKNRKQAVHERGWRVQWRHDAEIDRTALHFLWSAVKCCDSGLMILEGIYSHGSACDTTGLRSPLPQGSVLTSLRNRERQHQHWHTCTAQVRQILDTSTLLWFNKCSKHPVSVRRSIILITEDILGQRSTQNSQGCHQVSAALSWPRCLLECPADLKDKWCGPVIKAVCMGLGQHKERLSGSGRWPRLGQLSGFGLQTQPFLLKDLYKLLPTATVNHLARRWLITWLRRNKNRHIISYGIWGSGVSRESVQSGWRSGWSRPCFRKLHWLSRQVIESKTSLFAEATISGPWRMQRLVLANVRREADKSVVCTHKHLNKLIQNSGFSEQI